jgi:hypothetical protein
VRGQHAPYHTNMSSLDSDVIFPERAVPDFTIRIGEQQYKVNRGVLCNGSDFFASLLIGNASIDACIIHLKDSTESVAKRGASTTAADVNTIDIRPSFIEAETTASLLPLVLKVLYTPEDAFTLLPLFHIEGEVHRITPKLLLNSWLYVVQWFQYLNCSSILRILARELDQLYTSLFAISMGINTAIYTRSEYSRLLCACLSPFSDTTVTYNVFPMEESNSTYNVVTEIGRNNLSCAQNIICALHFVLTGKDVRLIEIAPKFAVNERRLQFSQIKDPTSLRDILAYLQEFEWS